MLWGVARSVHGLEGDVPQGVAVPVLHAHGRPRGSGVELRSVGPVRAALIGEEDGRTGRGRELAGAGQVVGMDVGLRHRGDRHPVLRGEVQVHSDVPARIDHDRVAGGLAADEVARLGQIFVIDSLEQHGSGPSSSVLMNRGQAPKSRVKNPPFRPLAASISA